MTNQLQVIEQKVKSATTMNRLAMALGYEAGTDDGKNAARKYAASVLAEIEKSSGAEYGDLTVCSADSVAQAMIDAANFRIQIDGRKFAHMEVRYNKGRKCSEAILQVDTNGFVAKIAEAFPDVEYSTSAVFDGDDLKITEQGDNKDYMLVRKNPFCSDVDKLQGVVVRISYTDKSGRRVNYVDTVNKTDLLAMKAAGKGMAWKTWTIERMRTAALKRCCKWHFRKLSLLQEMIEYDNKKNYDLEKPAITPSAGSVIDNLNKSLEEDTPIVTGGSNVIDIEESPEVNDIELEVESGEAKEITEEMAEQYRKEAKEQEQELLLNEEN